LEAQKTLKESMHAGALEEAMRSVRLFNESMGATGRSFALTKTMEGFGRNESLARSAFGPMWEIMKDSSVMRALEDVERTKKLARAALGPMWEISKDPSLNQALAIFQRDDKLARTAMGQSIENLRVKEDLARRAMEAFGARFCLPDFHETSRLFAELEKSSIAADFARFGKEASSLKLAMESMGTPWLDVQEKMRSVAGFAALQNIGHALHTMPAFDDKLTSALRAGLGDWRDPITWRPEIFEDYTVRSNFYESLGFNPALTDFPLPAFERSLDLADLPLKLPSADVADKTPVTIDDDEEGLRRTNAAHDSLQRLERHLRRFIDAVMTAAFGTDWARHRLPNGFYEDWQKKRQNAEDAGAEQRPLVDYADFTEYASIICKRDNWREVFQPVFVRLEDVRESFQRLHPIRLDIAHSRLITQDDELFLRVEMKRLVKAMSKQKQ
jgi:hypothetical protein